MITVSYVKNYLSLRWLRAGNGIQGLTRDCTSNQRGEQIAWQNDRQKTRVWESCFSCFSAFFILPSGVRCKSDLSCCRSTRHRGSGLWHRRNRRIDALGIWHLVGLACAAHHLALLAGWNVIQPWMVGVHLSDRSLCGGDARAGTADPYWVSVHRGGSPCDRSLGSMADHRAPHAAWRMASTPVRLALFSTGIDP